MTDKVDTVVVDAAVDNYDAVGPTQFEDVELLAVKMESGERHVWFDGTHFTANTTAETVSEGDKFYTILPEQQIYEVVEIDESATPPIEIKYLYPAGGTATDRISHDALTGLPVEDQPMGYTGPPKLLEEV
jgi:hypothetical protein